MLVWLYGFLRGDAVARDVMDVGDMEGNVCVFCGGGLPSSIRTRLR